MSRDRVVVVGAGVGGLVAAMMLAARGVETVLVEKQTTVGGRIRELTVAGRSIDAGPTVLTLRHVFDGIMTACGLDLAGLVRLTRADVLARHAWSPEERLDLFADRLRSADAIGSFAGAAARRGYLDFCAHSRRIYETMDPIFMRSERPTPIGMVKAVGLSGLGGLISSAPFTTLWDLLGRYFPDPRLRQLFGRYATYCGSSPFLAPATLALIAHVEQDGVWLVEGGMRAFADALAVAARTKGVEIRTGTSVAEILIKDGRARGLRLATGETIETAAVVSAVDVGALADGLLGADARSAVDGGASTPRSLSAATWGLVARVSGLTLAHHTVLFSRSSPQ
ncbi:MAG TPA: FAD-dependent oxidoreductase, partial [Hyphomicrobiaceae bacterium]|nr:FAD-dependent oxidoreductase [Hyphomicrobiaceae bacterium]